MFILATAIGLSRRVSSSLNRAARASTDPSVSGPKMAFLITPSVMLSSRGKSFSGWPSGQVATSSAQTCSITSP